MALLWAASPSGAANGPPGGPATIWPSPPLSGPWIDPGRLLDPGATAPAVFREAQFLPRPERRSSFWVVRTSDCPQVMGSDPWPCLQVLQFDADGHLLPSDLGALLAQAAAGRPVLVIAHGNLNFGRLAINTAVWGQEMLLRYGALPPEAVVVLFDWPSDRVYHNDLRDLHEKMRRAFVSGYHLARFLQAFPPGSRLCLLGQSDGGRLVSSALHLLGGGLLDSMDHDPPVGLPGGPPSLRLRAVVIAAASDHDWLNPGKRFDHALWACEAFLNLYNRCDRALLPYPLARLSGHHRALGRIGLQGADHHRLGPWAARYAERDMHPYLGREHTLYGALVHPQIARWIAFYTWSTAAPLPPG
ncbi:MAG: hypothetical protein IRY99_00420 [Isosphaeraceae bacterium]|nr:hypothetical protein [Isosphaeraceae bacterium]